MDPLAPSALPARAAMLPSFGPLYYALGLPWLFRRLRMEDHSAERVRRAAQAGPLVYAMHTRSRVDWLALNAVLADRRLPLAEYTPGIDALPFMPLGRTWREWQRGPDRRDPHAILAGALRAGRPCGAFMVPGRDLGEMVGDLVGDVPADTDVAPTLLEVQADHPRPIQVLPVVVIWNKRPEPARTEVGRFLLGSEDNAGPFGKLLSLATAQDAIVQVGEPISIAAWRERFAEQEPALRAKALRLALRRYLYREAQVVRGPRARPRGWVRRQVLQSREIADLVKRESEATGQDPRRLRAKVAGTLDHIAAQFSFPVVRFAAWACWQIWNRIYSGIDVRDQDLDRIRSAIRAGPAVLVPCHRSHLDYLLISSLLFERDIGIPHIVAGENLSFFPLGPFFRRCGAFFIKRSFSGDRVFPVVFARYIKELLRLEVPLEFFIEGGRSRTGKLLPPKTGVLAMVLDGAADLREDHELSFVPIYVGYEQIAEERAYARELAGVKKERENVGQVVRATTVLGQRYGKVYLRVGEPLVASSLVDRKRWPALGRAQRDEVLLAFGERILHRINKEAVALPTSVVALALLAHPRRGVRHEELRARVARIRKFLAAAEVHEGGGIGHIDGLLAEALGRFQRGKLVSIFEEDGARVYTLVPEGRVTLAYYKNAVIHAFVPAAYYATAVRALGKDQVDHGEVSKLFTSMQFLLRYEFVLDPDVDVETLESRAIAALVAYGALESADGKVRVLDRPRVSEIANLVACHLESYLLLLRTARDVAVSVNELPAAALRRGKQLLAADEITRPEALNLQDLQGAARAFREDGVIQVAEDGRVTLDRAAWNGWHDQLGFLLGVEGHGAG